MNNLLDKFMLVTGCESVQVYCSNNVTTYKAITERASNDEINFHIDIDEISDELDIITYYMCEYNSETDNITLTKNADIVDKRTVAIKHSFEIARGHDIDGIDRIFNTLLCEVESIKQYMFMAS